MIKKILGLREYINCLCEARYLDPKVTIQKEELDKMDKRELKVIFKKFKKLRNDLFYA